MYAGTLFRPALHGRRRPVSRNLILEVFIHVCMKKWKDIHSACLADCIHTLDDHFAETFACAHDVGRIYCLIRTDQDKS